MAHHLADPRLVRQLAQPGRPLEVHQQHERLVVPCCPHLEVLLLGVHVVALVVGLVDHVVGLVEVVQVDLVAVLVVEVLVVDQVGTTTPATPLVGRLHHGSMVPQSPSPPPRSHRE